MGIVPFVSPDPLVPPPPEDVQDLLDWASEHGVAARLDDVVFGREQMYGRFMMRPNSEVLTYRQVLINVARHDADEPWYPDAEGVARRSLHRVASAVARQREMRSWMDSHGRDPADETLQAFLIRLRQAVGDLAATGVGPRPPGIYQVIAVRVAAEPAPMFCYEERPVADPAPGGRPGSEEVALLLLGWNEGALRWAHLGAGRTFGRNVSPVEQVAAITAMMDFLRDPRCRDEQETLAELLRLPAWRYAIGKLDANLARIEGAQAGAAITEGSDDGHARRPKERLAFRVVETAEGVLDVHPVVQKRGRHGAFSKGSRLQWHVVPDRADLTPADRRVYLAYDDRFARTSSAWGGWRGAPPNAAQVFGILRALIDHPAVFLDGRPAAAVIEGGRAQVREGGSAVAGPRLDIRQGRLRLRFHTASDGALTAQFELLGVPLLAADVARALADDRHLVHLHRGDGARAAAAQVLLATVTPQAAAVVRALALAPARFPPEAHDALAARLDSLQEAMDIEFPSHWTRTVGPADGQLIARLELLASGAVQIRLVVRPVKLGPVFAPGEGPALVLEGQGRDRHGARRDRQAERQSGHALAERLGLGGGEEIEPWCWRVGEGDPALHLVATLQDLADQVRVEWADDGGFFLLGSVSRADMRLKVADRRDWFGVTGGAEVGSGAKREIVPLSDLLAAIREDRRYVAVGARGFVRIEASLREALARAEAAVFEMRGAIQVSTVGSDPLMGLVEYEAQLEASEAFTALRRRVKDSEVETPSLPPALEAVLRPYQKSGVEWMVRLSSWGAGAILADEMGLGKTVQTLAVLAHRAGGGPALVVAPTSVVPNWVNEAKRFAPGLRVHLHRGPDRLAGLRGVGAGDVVVTSYAIATIDVQALEGMQFGTLVLDEAQAVKNAATDRAKALRQINAQWRLGLTGTPIENHLGELWSLLRLISPGLLGSWEQFRARYAGPIEKFGDEGRRQALASLLRPFVLRRTKAAVAPELPARTEVVRVISLSPEELALYNQLRQATLDELERAKKDPDRDAGDMRFVLLAALTRLRQLCCHPRLVYPRTHVGSAKAAYLLDLLGELREGGHRVLVFSQFRSFLELLAPRLDQHGFRVLTLDGTTPAEARERRIAAFQAEQADVFLISLKAGGFGLNLTAADTVIHLDPWWNPAVEDQATARAHRIGQQKPVTAVRLVAEGTIEEAVLGLHAAKRELAAGILEGGDVAAAWGTDELVDLIRRGDRSAAA